MTLKYSNPIKEFKEKSPQLYVYQILYDKFINYIDIETINNFYDLLKQSKSLNIENKRKVVLYNFNKDKFFKMYQILKDEEKSFSNLQKRFPQDINILKERANEDWNDVDNFSTISYSKIRILNILKG